MCRQLTCLIVLGLAIGMTSAQATLVYHWKLDENTATGATTAADSIGGLNGTIEGATSVPGRAGNALSFDGSDDVVTILGFVPPHQGTVVFWMDPGFGSSKQRIFGAGGDYEVIVYSTGIVRNELFASGSGTLQSNAGAVEPGQWFHIAVTYAYDSAGPSTALEVYVNGELDVVGTAGEPTIPTSTTLLFGHRAGAAGGEHYGGLLDDLRIYDHVLSEAEIKALANPPRMSARDPSPPDGAVHEDTWANLSWNPGDSAVSHDVYLSDNFDGVNEGTADAFRGNQPTTDFLVGFPGFHYPEGLVPGTTYYWRIDEVNDNEPNSPWKGDIWSFSIPPRTAYNPDPAEGAEFVDPDVVLTWTAGFGAKLHHVYIGDSFADVNDGTGDTYKGPVGTARFAPGTLEKEKVYYWRVDEFDAFETHKGDIWSFTTPGAAGILEPANGAVGVPMTPTLSWIPATNAISHDLYFGFDRDTVANATKESPEYKGNKKPGSEKFNPGKLGWRSPWYWRVDAIYDTGPVKGLVWTFTVADFLLIDDFESYNDIDPPDPNSNRIFDKWIDGYGTTTNGALVGNPMPPYAEQTIVHGGAQSMNYAYDNAGKTSEATLTLVSLRDWTQESVDKLTLWFRGNSANAADRMYIALNGNAVVYHDDQAVTQIPGWNEWNIELSVFGELGVDFTNVDSITIGIGTKNAPVPDGGAGTMYFDEITLIR